MSTEYFIAPLSFAQERLWFLDQLAPGSAFYNIHVALPLAFAVDERALARSLEEIVRRHEALRTFFLVREGQPLQAVASVGQFEVALSDLRALPEQTREEELVRLATGEAQQPFDLGRGPLLRARLVRLGSHESVLLLTLHHIVADGWSMDILSRELETLYSAYTAGRPSPLAELPIQYRDFAAWQRAWLTGERLQTELSYWQTQLKDAPTILELPTDRPRPAVQTSHGAYQSRELGTEVTDAVKTLGREEGVTLFMTLLAAFATLLHRYTGREDLVIGTPIANRNRPELEDLIGFFVNTLLLRLDLSGDPSFRQLLGRVRTVALDAYAHQDLPFERLVAELQPERHLSHAPLFQVMFAHQASIGARPESVRFGFGGPAGYAPAVVERGTSKFDLTLFTEENSGQLSTLFEYSTDLFDDDRVERMLGHLETLLAGIAADPDTPVSRLPLLTEAEQQQLHRWNQTERPYPQQPIHHLLAQQAARNPHQPALQHNGHTTSYQQLDQHANQLAHYLQTHGARTDTTLAVLQHRTPTLITSLLATLKTGAAYLPLDPNQPTLRLQQILTDAQPTLILTQTGLTHRLPPNHPPTITLDNPHTQTTINQQPTTPPTTHTTPHSPAYLIYTSGSTGQPKGVTIEHGSVVRLVCETDYVELTPQDAVLAFAPISFDASTFEIWGALLNGARLVIAPTGLVALDELEQLIEDEGVTTLWLTASLFHEFIEGARYPLRSLRQLLAGGDVLSPPHVLLAREKLPHCQLINGYGPTEGTTFSCCHEIGDEDLDGSPIPIGRPIANTRVYVLDRVGGLLPVGVPGELYIGGAGVARGYHNQPELTGERFLPDPFRPGGRLYRTGDQVRQRADGSLEFLGRLDDQVKIRGYRIEPAEIEAALHRHPHVRQAAVLVHTNDNRQPELAAYYVADPATSTSHLRTHLRTHLPDYMQPTHLIPLSRLPTSPNGKLDRTQLPTPSTTRPPLDQPYTAPQNTLERTITQTWQQTLNRTQIGTHDNFFDLGGHSLLLVKLQRDLQHQLQHPITLVELFQYPTIHTLAAHLARTYGEPDGRATPSSRSEVTTHG